MKKIEIIGQQQFYIFRNIKTGQEVSEPCTEEEYAYLATKDCINPTKKGYVFLGGFQGPKFDTEDGFLEPDSYADDTDGVSVIFKDEDGLHDLMEKGKFLSKVSKGEVIKKIWQ